MFLKLLIITVIGSLSISITPGTAQIQSSNNLEAKSLSTGKQLYIPPKVYRIPENNDYSNSESDYSFKRMVEADNITIFWHKEFGNDPTSNSNERKRFDPKEAIRELERFYDYYVNDLKLVQKGNSLTDKYKM